MNLISQKKMRIVIPTEDDAGLNSRISDHFGRAPYFTVVEIDEQGNVIRIESIPSKTEHLGGVGKGPDKVLPLGPDAIIVRGMGFRALERFKSAGVKVYRTFAITVREAIELFKGRKLEEMFESYCGRKY